jgi:hypothetical protein
LLAARPTATVLGTFEASVGIALLLGNYLAGVTALKNDPGFESGESSRRAKRSLVQGILLSLLLMAVVSFRRNPGDALMQVTEFLLSFCYCLFGLMFGVGILCLIRLWRGLSIPPGEAQAVRVRLAPPNKVSWLVAGLCSLLAVGTFADRLPVRLAKEFATEIAQGLFWAAMAVVLYRLWTSRKTAALVARAALLLLFTAIMLPAAMFYFYWIGTQPDRPLAFLATAAGLLNLLYYFQMESTAAPPQPI